MSDKSTVDWAMVETLLAVVGLTVQLPTFKALQSEAMDALSAIQVDVVAARKKFAEAAKEKADADAASAKAKAEAEAEKQAKAEAMPTQSQTTAQPGLFRNLSGDSHAS
jgi:hypothetical protein